MRIHLQQRLDLPMTRYRLQYLRIHASLGCPGAVSVPQIMDRMAYDKMHNPQDIPAIQQVIPLTCENLFAGLIQHPSPKHGNHVHGQRHHPIG